MQMLRQMLRLIQLSTTTMLTGSHTLEPMELMPTPLTPTQPIMLVTPPRLLSHILPRLSFQPRRSCQLTPILPTLLDSVCSTSAKLRLIPTLFTPMPMDSTMGSTMVSHTPLVILATTPTHTLTRLLATLPTLIHILLQLTTTKL